MKTHKRFGLTGVLPLVIAAVLVGVPPSVGQQSPQQATVSELVKVTLDSVVFIEVSDTFGKPFASGSGFIVSSDGRIVTNHHVIAGAHSAIVKLNNGAKFTVDGVIADDSDHDLAVIKVAGKNLPLVALGDSNSVHVGDHVVAIGSPLKWENSVSDGIVSGFREVAGRPLIQTTAPISHGNSGGPLLAMDGKVVAVITSKDPEGENLNFAVPSKLIPPFANSTARPLDSVSSTAAGIGSDDTGAANVWTSMTSGRDLKIRKAGDYIYVEWVNIPAPLQSTTAFIRSELKREGDKWTGKSREHLPCEFKSSYLEFWTTGQTRGTPNVNWCSIESDIRIDKLSDNRIEGMIQAPSEFDCRKCQVLEREPKPFTWIPK